MGYNLCQVKTLKKQAPTMIQNKGFWDSSIRKNSQNKSRFFWNPDCWTARNCWPPNVVTWHYSATCILIPISTPLEDSRWWGHGPDWLCKGRTFNSLDHLKCCDVMEISTLDNRRSWFSMFVISGHWNHHPIPQLGRNFQLVSHKSQHNPNPSILKLKQLSRCRFQIALGNAEFAAYRRSSIDNEKKKNSNNLTLVTSTSSSSSSNDDNDNHNIHNINNRNSSNSSCSLGAVLWIQDLRNSVFVTGRSYCCCKMRLKSGVFFGGGRMSSVRAGHTVQKDAFQQKKWCPSARSEWRSLISTSFIFHSSMSHFHKTEVSLPCTSGCGCGTFTRTAWWCFFQQLHDFTSWFMSLLSVAKKEQITSKKFLTTACCINFMSSGLYSKVA